ncbi:MAG: RdgB/HAM1 family non-canonical purine NTP pyrophosphatase [Spirochaetes bacterium]|nr:RdgB/HAM1 family non-canonical purine NTP pyrophosphatase [Spirochaetota bacterium]
MRLYIATENAGKLREMRAIFGAALPAVQLFCIADLPEVKRTAYKAEETATTYAGNALIKVKALGPLVGADAWVLGEDSGFEVEALRGAPGVYSARYAENDAARCAKILRALEGMPGKERRAQFVACVALLDPGGNPTLFFGRKTGFVAPAAKGGNGFGYDSIFCPELGGPTWGELTGAEKNNDSHRSRALQSVMTYLKSMEVPG